MAKQTRDTLLRTVFNDYKNYPYGFSRSGDFSIKEAQSLHKYGNLINALLDGVVEPSNSEEESLLEVALGNKSPSSATEKAWCRYQARINRPKAASIYGRKVGALESEDVDNVELEVELDD